MSLSGKGRSDLQRGSPLQNESEAVDKQRLPLTAQAQAS